MLFRLAVAQRSDVREEVTQPVERLVELERHGKSFVLDVKVPDRKYGVADFGLVYVSPDLLEQRRRVNGERLAERGIGLDALADQLQESGSLRPPLGIAGQQVVDRRPGLRVERAALAHLVVEP